MRRSTALFVPLAAALFVLLYLLTAPDAVNLDGLGYYKLLPHNFAAGHLLFMPLYRATVHGSGLHPLLAGRLLDAILGAGGLLLTYEIACRLLAPAPYARFAAALAAIGLGLSYGYWSESADLESYAAATVALLVTVRAGMAYAARPTLARAMATGVCLGCAVLFHVEHVVLSVFVAVTLWQHAPSRARGTVHVSAALALGGAISLVAYAYAAFVVRGHDPRGALRWVLTAGHGFAYGGGAYRLADGLYGLCKALIYAPYLYESDAPRLLGQFLLGLAPLLSLGALAWKRRRPQAGARGPLAAWSRSLWAWVVPYAGLAIAFFGSDPERWLFILPALFILAGALIAEERRRGIVAVGVVAYLGGLNLVTGIWPPHADRSIRARVEASSAGLHEGDLVLFPGHSWDEYVSLYAPAKIVPFPVAYYAARDGIAACLARLDLEVKKAAARGGRIYALRLFDEGDPGGRRGEDDRRGFDELQQLGLDRARLRERILLRLTPVEPPSGAPIVRLDPKGGT